MTGFKISANFNIAKTIYITHSLRSPRPSTAKMMADPFEVRMRFTAQLQHLNASITSSQKAAHYALKYRDMDEDLHSCILEQLERVRIILYSPFSNQG